MADEAVQLQHVRYEFSLVRVLVPFTTVDLNQFLRDGVEVLGAGKGSKQVNGRQSNKCSEREREHCFGLPLVHLHLDHGLQLLSSFPIWALLVSPLSTSLLTKMGLEHNGFGILWAFLQ